MADQKLTALTELTAPTLDDLIYVVDAPGGTPASRKVTIKNLHTADAGTSFPASPTAGQRFFRTDLGWLCFYDGTRWLTVHEYTTSVSYIGAAVDGALFGNALRTDYDQYFTRVAIKTRVNTTNDGSNYWTVITYIWNIAQATATALDTFTTSGDTVNVWTNHERVPATTSLPGATNKHYASLQIAKTLAPGVFDVYATFCYRLIVT